MNSTRITRHRFCLALIVSLLFCGLSSIEVREFVSLTDDTSNDFTLEVSTLCAPAVPVDEATGPDLSATRESGEQVEYSVQVPVQTPTPPSQAEYRILLCIYRT